MNCRKEPVCLICSKGLVNVNSRGSSICVEGRASTIWVVGRSPSVRYAVKGSSM